MDQDNNRAPRPNGAETVGPRPAQYAPNAGDPQGAYGPGCAMPLPQGGVAPPPYAAPSAAFRPCEQRAVRPHGKASPSMPEIVGLALGILCFLGIFFFSDIVHVFALLFGIVGIIVTVFSQSRGEFRTGVGLAALIVCILSSGLVAYSLLAAIS